jgi:MoxR-like ATPase
MKRIVVLLGVVASVLGFVRPAEAQPPTAKGGTIAGNGTAEIKRQPQFLRVQIEDIAYPSPQQEEEIVLCTTTGPLKLPEATFDPAAFLSLRELVLAVPVPQHVAAYAVRLCGASRPGDVRADAFVQNYVAWGAGPRGSQNLVLAAKALALLHGRTAPTAEDVRAVTVPILRHRIIVNHRAVGDNIAAPRVVDHLLEKVAA